MLGQPLAVTDQAPQGFRQSRYAAPPGATTVLLVRHGESAPHIPGEPFPLVDGHGDPALHTVGVEQALRLGERLAKEHIDAVYVTTLRRTLETARPLLDRLRIEPRVEPDLREVHLGEWEGGLLRVKAAERDPVFLRVIEEERWDVIPGAEPLADFQARVQGGLGRVIAAHPDERVVVVAHGGVIGQILHQAVGGSPFAFSAVDNASISEIVAVAGRQILRRYNDTAHLAP